MRRVTAFVLRSRRAGPAFVLACLAVSAIASPAEAAPGGVVRGVVTNGTTGQPQAGVEVRLLGGRRSAEGSFEQEVSTTTTTDDEGRFRFTGLPSGGERIYTLDFYYQGGAFPGGAVGIPSNDDVIEVTQKVFDTTTDPRAIVVQKDSMFLLKGDEGVQVVHSFEIVNVSTEAYIGRGAGSAGPQDKSGAGSAGPQDKSGAGSAGPAPTLSFSFPDEARREGVRILDSDLDIPRLLDTETGLSITSAIPPGETNITFGYSLRVNTGQVELGRLALYPTLNLDVFAEPPFVVDSPRLVADGEATIEGTSYTRYRSEETITEGSAIQILATAEAGSDPALIGGALVAALLFVGLVAFALLRRRAPAASKRSAPTPQPQSREDLLVAIAGLDLEYGNRKLDRRDYETRRAALKRRIAELESAEPAR